ncbi:MAG: glycoside hydrolase family 3 C-terminal domain-containing protein [Paludibacteraceae bacterium]|nr:glycoside hydrolase family 3 C-terminal domain-containing protein [Paludibacteraceae bacterium]
MRKIAILASCLLSVLFAQAQTVLTPNTIDQVIKEMTVEEKVDLLIGCGQGKGKFPGSAGRSRDIPRFGITSAYMADGPHRLIIAEKREFDSHEYITTEFPSGANCAATFDVEAVKSVGAAIGREVSDYGLDILLAPGENLLRSPLCGRNNEYYSEDPLLSGKIAAAYINGVQSNGIGACLKHFAVNNQETNRNMMDSRVSERALRELYLRNFEIAVKEAQPWTIMTSYNKVNGKYTCEDRRLTETILRGDWGFQGLVMTDWNAGRDAVASINAGNDMIQPGQQKQREAILAAAKDGTIPMELLDLSVRRTLELVLKTKTYAGYNYPEETDLKAHAALTRKVAAEGIVLLQNNGALPFSEKVQQVALYGQTSFNLIAATTGFGGTIHGHTLVGLVEGLRNAGLTTDMELAQRYVKHIADENKRLYPNGLPPFSITPLNRPDEMPISAEEMAEQVKNNCIAVVTIGRISGEGADRNSKEFYLTDGELGLLKQVSAAYHAAGKQVVVLLNVCSPIETASWRDMADAVVCAFEPGQETGNSIVDVLTGKVNPSGRLPMTWALKYGDAAADANFPSEYVFDMSAFFKAYANSDNMKNAAEANQKYEEPKPIKDVDYTNYDEDIWMGYRYFDTKKVAVAYPFGYGLSYTDFGYELLKSEVVGDKSSVTVKVTNTGKVAGREVVQVYVHAAKGSMDKPEKELRAFAKTGLIQPGQSEVVTLEWKTGDMASFNTKANAWELAKGTYTIMVAHDVNDVRCTATAKVDKKQLYPVNK